jgi:hypothetical protein
VPFVLALAWQIAVEAAEAALAATAFLEDAHARQSRRRGEHAVEELGLDTGSLLSKMPEQPALPLFCAAMRTSLLVLAGKAPRVDGRRERAPNDRHPNSNPAAFRRPRRYLSVPRVRSTRSSVIAVGNSAASSAVLGNWIAGDGAG